jgi:hypothetical protein
MKSILTTTLTLVLSIFLFSSCGNDASLQKYIVEKQNDNDFITIDIPSSLILTENNNLNEEQLESVKSIKKVNLVALRVKEDNKARYEIEKQRVQKILSDDKYETLMKYGSNDMGATLMFTGNVDAIDEIIIFASDEEKGFGLFRVIGEDMNPTQIVRLMDGVNSKNFDFSFMSQMIWELR